MHHLSCPKCGARLLGCYTANDEIQAYSENRRLLLVDPEIFTDLNKEDWDRVRRLAIECPLCHGTLTLGTTDQKQTAFEKFGEAAIVAADFQLCEAPK